MKFMRVVMASAMALGLSAANSSAVPLGAVPSGSGDLVIKVQEDCHADVRRHYVPRYGRVLHRHNANCRVILVERDDDDDGPRDCHRDVRRHFLREYGGSVLHRHVGNSCRVRVYQRDDRGQGGNCIYLGPIRFCEN